MSWALGLEMGLEMGLGRWRGCAESAVESCFRAQLSAVQLPCASGNLVAGLVCCATGSMSVQMRVMIQSPRLCQVSNSGRLLGQEVSTRVDPRCRYLPHYAAACHKPCNFASSSLRLRNEHALFGHELTDQA